MKKLLIIALILIVGCSRYEDKGKGHPKYLAKKYNSRFDKWFGNQEWYVNGEWMTEKEWNERND